MAVRIRSAKCNALRRGQQPKKAKRPTETARSVSLKDLIDFPAARLPVIHDVRSGAVEYELLRTKAGGFAGTVRKFKRGESCRVIDHRVARRYRDADLPALRWAEVVRGPVPAAKDPSTGGVTSLAGPCIAWRTPKAARDASDMRERSGGDFVYESSYVGSIGGNKSGVGARAWCIERRGNAVWTTWGAVEVVRRSTRRCFRRVEGWPQQRRDRRLHLQATNALIKRRIAEKTGNRTSGKYERLRP